MTYEIIKTGKNEISPDFLNVGCVEVNFGCIGVNAGCIGTDVGCPGVNVSCGTNVACGGGGGRNCPIDEPWGNGELT